MEKDRPAPPRLTPTLLAPLTLGLCSFGALPIAAQSWNDPASIALGSADLSRVPFWDQETADGLLNRYGGQPGASNGLLLTSTTNPVGVRSGNAALQLTAFSPIQPGQLGFVQTTLAPTTNQHNRDLTGYAAAEVWLRNDTGQPFTFTVEIKDDRDSNAHRASWSQPIAAGTQWQRVAAPLDLATPGWSILGQPDLRKAGRFSYLVQPSSPAPVQGTIYLDDAAFLEPGGPIDVNSAPLTTMVERLAERQFRGLWGSRNHATGYVPLHNTNSTGGALNATSGLLHVLPSAVQRGWVTAAEADAYATTLAASLNTNLNQTDYLPARYVDWNTLAPAAGIGGEESSVDAAFMALALHQYKNAPHVAPQVAADVDAVQQRFNFQPFSDTVGNGTTNPRGWSFANRADTGLTPGTYNSYSGEPWVISLAAALSETYPVPIETQWNSAIFRTRDHLGAADDGNYLVSTFDANRPPFVQWLLPLFADTSDRGSDTYPIASLASNPEHNAARYQADVAAYFAQIGRENFLQPDAGDNGSGLYEQFSAFANFGNPDVFMPWAVAFALMGDAQTRDAAEAALRHHLLNDLEGPLGLADSAVWATGASEPTAVAAFMDFWNLALSTMAMIDFLDAPSADFAALPEVAAVLDAVFQIAGDYNGSGSVEQGDLDLVLNNWGQGTPVGQAAPAGWLNDLPQGAVDQRELDRVLNNWGSADAPDFAGSAVPEPTAGIVAAVALVALRRRR